MNIKQQFLTVNPYSRPGTKLTSVTKVAVHYTGDPGATAQQEHDYFESLSKNHARYVSCHYVVGLQGEIIQCIPETEWSYCTNQANGYSISIETCHPDATGKFNSSSEQSLVELVADICKRHGLDPEKDVIRHYDVTGKECPLWYVTHPNAYLAFKQRVKDTMYPKPTAYGVRVGKFTQRERANIISGYITKIGFYNVVKPMDGQYVIDVFSFSQKAKADALQYILTKQAFYNELETKSGQYGLKIFSFKIRDTAQELYNVLKTLGIYSIVDSIATGGYEVRVEWYTDKARAEALSALLGQSLYSSVINV